MKNSEGSTEPQNGKTQKLLSWTSNLENETLRNEALNLENETFKKEISKLPKWNTPKRNIQTSNGSKIKHSEKRYPNRPLERAAA